jgi:hypothetical protein
MRPERNEHPTKQILAKLKRKTTHTSARAAVAVTTLVPLAALLGGVKLNNHNETLVRDRVG